MLSYVVLAGFAGFAGFASGFQLPSAGLVGGTRLNAASVARSGTALGLSMQLTKPRADPNYNDKNLDHIFKNNKRWVTEQTRNDPDFFDRMKDGQSPKFLWIGEYGFQSIQSRNSE